MNDELGIEDTSRALQELRESNHQILELTRVQGAKIDWVIESYERLTVTVQTQGQIIRTLQKTVMELLDDQTPRRYTPKRFKLVAESILRFLDDSRSGEIAFGVLRETFELHPRDLTLVIREVTRIDPRVKIDVCEKDRRAKRLYLVRDEEGGGETRIL